MGDDNKSLPEVRTDVDVSNKSPGHGLVMNEHISTSVTIYFPV